VHAGNYGLMQIRLSTARAMGYTGSAAGLLDPQTNMTYALRYLAGAYRAAGGNESRAVALYSRGYYNQAKTQGFSPYASGTVPTAGLGFQTSFQPALQTSARSAEQYGLRHRHHYHA
jgi:soluble lytic murein transglycosylase-like protein